MPNNSSARQKKQSKKKKPPLHKEDKASVDSTSLSLTGKDATSKDKANRDASSLSLTGKDATSKDKANLDASSLSLAGTDATADLPDSTLRLEFYHSLTDQEKHAIHVEVMNTNPGASPNELVSIKRAVLLKAALEAREKKIQDARDISHFPPSPAGSVSKAAKPTDASSKDVSLSLLHLGTVKTATPLSLKAQPKSDASLEGKPYSLSLTKEERTPIFEATKLANPNADHKAFILAYKIALWKADSQKRGVNQGNNLGSVDISLFSDTGDEDSSGEDSDSSEDGMQAIRNDLLRQKQVSSPTSPLQNKFLAGFMKSPDKPRTDAQAKQALDEDPFSLTPSVKQAEDSSLNEKQGQNTGNVTGHGGIKPSQRGSLSLDLLDVAQLADRQSAADVIRNGSFLSLSQTAAAIGNNSDASPQVDAAIVAPRSEPSRSLEHAVQRCQAVKRAAEALMERSGSPGDISTFSMVQAITDGQNHQEAAASSKVVGQRVLSEAFCINRLEQIRQLAGNAKLKKLADGSIQEDVEGGITQLFRRFRCENVEGDPPYFCVSASIIGRLIHTFKEDYVTRAKALHLSLELDHHVDDIVEKAKESMSQDATAIRMQTQNLIAKQQKLCADAHVRCEAALAAANTRMKEASKAYGDAYEEALNKQLQTVVESSITEDTLNQEMVVAAEAHRDNIQKNEGNSSSDS